jgi:hypothetical protein
MEIILFAFFICLSPLPKTVFFRPTGYPTYGGCVPNTVMAVAADSHCLPLLSEAMPQLGQANYTPETPACQYRKTQQNITKQTT